MLVSIIQKYGENVASNISLFRNTIVWALLCVLLLLLIVFLKKIVDIKNIYIKNFFLHFFPPLLNFAMMQLMYSESLWLTSELLAFKFGAIVANALIILAVQTFVYCMFKNYGIATIFTSVVCFIFGLINHYLLIFRSSPLVAWDIASFTTALSVVKGYKFELSVIVLQGFVLLVLLIALEYKIHKKIRVQDFTVKLKVFKRSFVSLLSVLTLFIMINTDIPNTIFRTTDNTWSPLVSCMLNGQVYTFCRTIRYASLKKPENFSVSNAQEIINDNKNNSNSILDTSKITKPQSEPNIIVIMNESFADLSVLGEINTNIDDYIPYYHSIEKNLVHGNLVVSAYGGGTSTTEFEFLTGLTMSFLPSGSTPYQQFIKKPIESLPSYLKEYYDYKTIAIHPYYENGWSRNKVYPLMGFDDFLSEERWRENPERVRQYISDKENYQAIIQYFEEKEENEKLFIFNVTMQNHGAYEDKEFVSNVKITDAPSQYPEVEQYMSLLNISDQSLKYLLEYFEDYNEEVVVVFFGDHQPGLSSSFFENYLNSSKINNNNTQLVPFMIWSNYQENTNEIYEPLTISTNYLSTVLLEYIGLKQTDVNSFLQNMHEYAPVIVFDKFVNGDFEQIANSTDLKTMKEKYNILEYYFLNYK